MSLLATELEVHAEALVERALQAMYANPFWEERFGERGRRFAREDNHHHLAYLALALRVESPEPLVRYARWLREVLATRGMCTRHLSENFARLSDAITDEAVAGSEPAHAYLQAAREVLLYADDPARALQTGTPDVAGQAARTLYGRHPEWLNRWGEAGRARCADDLAYHLSYLTDALAFGREELFADYLAWMAGFLARRSIPVEHLAEALQLLPGSAREAARPMLNVGRARLAAPMR